MNQLSNDNDEFARKARHTLLAWAALIALLLTSLGSAYLSLGLFNPVVSMTIAVLKTAIVVWLFMRLKQASALVRIVSATGVATLALLLGLTGVDYTTRATESTPMQQPRQLPALREPGSSP